MNVDMSLGYGLERLMRVVGASSLSELGKIAEQGEVDTRFQLHSPLASLSSPDLSFEGIIKQALRHVYPI